MTELTCHVTKWSKEDVQMDVVLGCSCNMAGNIYYFLGLSAARVPIL